MLLHRRSDTVELLKTVPLFGGLSNRHLGMLARCGQVRASREVDEDDGFGLPRLQESADVLDM